MEKWISDAARTGAVVGGEAAEDWIGVSSSGIISTMGLIEVCLDILDPGGVCAGGVGGEVGVEGGWSHWCGSGVPNKSGGAPWKAVVAVAAPVEEIPPKAVLAVAEAEVGPVPEEAAAVAKTLVLPVKLMEAVPKLFGSTNRDGCAGEGGGGGIGEDEGRSGVSAGGAVATNGSLGERYVTGGGGGEDIGERGSRGQC